MLYYKMRHQICRRKMSLIFIVDRRTPVVTGKVVYSMLKKNFCQVPNTVDTLFLDKPYLEHMFNLLLV